VTGPSLFLLDFSDERVMTEAILRLSTEAKAVLLVSEIVRRVYGGTIPDDPTRLIAAAITVFIPDGTPREVEQHFAYCLAQAVDLLRRQQTCQWAN
jgi:hypothetical protein